MTPYLINQFQQNWRGPRLDLLIGEKPYQLGSGQPTAQVSLPASLVKKIMLRPSMAFGEAYMSGQLKVTGDLMPVLRGFHQSPDLAPTYLRRFRSWLAHLPTNQATAEKNAQHHYDLSNDFYKLWLDPSLTYTCAYFPSGNESLEQAQHNKRELICRKIQLQSDHTFLDIGCGWGSLLFHALEKFNVKQAVGVTPSREQVAYLKSQAKRRGLSDRLTIIESDWRALKDYPEQFDRIASVGMFEHVGLKQYPEFLDLWSQLLKPTGLSMLHTIGQTFGNADPFIEKYIFPGGYLPSLEQIATPAQRAQLRLFDVENLRRHYAQTLHHWHDNFTHHESQIRDQFDDKFIRMWRLYLQASEAGFRWGNLNLWQIVLAGRSADWPWNRQVW